MSADIDAEASASSEEAEELRKRNRLEFVIAIMLGLVSIGIAYASFQAALYDSKMDDAYQESTALSAEAESLYLEGNQTFVQDAQLWNQLTQLIIEMDSADPAIAANATSTFEVLYFQAVSVELDAAITWADEQNEADPDVYYSPLDSEDYQTALFGGYAETKEQAVGLAAQGDDANSLSDRLMLYTVLMSISLFLLGIAAVVRQYRVQLMLVITGTAVFLVSMVLTLFVPFIGL